MHELTFLYFSEACNFFSATLFNIVCRRISFFTLGRLKRALRTRQLAVFFSLFFFYKLMPKI